MILGRDQGAVTNSGENNPPMLKSKKMKAKYIKMRAIKKSGTAKPINPKNVNV